MVDYETNLQEFIKHTLRSTHVSSSAKVSVFDYNYIPRDIYARKEIKEIIKIIIDFEKLGTNRNVFYYGSRGSGKTCTMKFLQSLMKKHNIKTPILYINCRTLGTSFRVLSSILKERVIGLGFADIMEKINQIYPKLILILDEIDLISMKERSKDLLYLLSRSEGTKYQLFLLSNNVTFYNKIDEATKSTLTLKNIHFRDYNAVEILKILQLRLKEANIKGTSNGFLEELAARTVSETNSDVRVALKCMELAFNENNFENAGEYFKKAKEDVFLQTIQYLNDQLLFTVKSINLSEDKITPRVYDIYKKITKLNNEKCLSYPTFLNNIGYLQSVGVILSLNEKVGRNWSSRIELLCRPELITKIYKEKALKY